MAGSGIVRMVDGETVVDVWVVPGASRSAVAGVHDGALRLRVSAPPAKGKANRAAARLLEEVFGVAPVLVRGTTSRRKTFLLPDCGLEEAERRVERIAGQ